MWGNSLVKILIADDDVSVALLLKTLLQIEGYQVVTTAHGSQIVQLIETEKPDLVLLDFYLGAQQGVRVLETIRGVPSVAHTPVLLTSALDHRYEGEKAGADGFIQKPFGANDLLLAIEQLLAAAAKNESIT
jgi:DNA-binding response OmpR family regulator